MEAEPATPAQVRSETLVVTAVEQEGWNAITRVAFRFFFAYFVFGRLRRPSAALARRRAAARRDLRLGTEFFCRARHPQGHAAPTRVFGRAPSVEPSPLSRCTVAG